MKTVFLDTAGLLALWDSSDQWHSAALQDAVQPMLPVCYDAATKEIDGRLIAQPDADSP
jgi:hypothetical protein